MSTKELLLRSRGLWISKALTEGDPPQHFRPIIQHPLYWDEFAEVTPKDTLRVDRGWFVTAAQFKDSEVGCDYFRTIAATNTAGPNFTSKGRQLGDF